MSRIGDYRIELQEMSEYRDGYYAFDRGEPRHCFVLQGKAAEAWFLGWDDAKTEKDTL